MSTRVRFIKDFKGYKKGEVALLRTAEAHQAFQDKAAVVQTDINPVEVETKGSNGNTPNLRSHKPSRRKRTP